MNCYVHAKEGSPEQAVAVCRTCGMGVCLQHAVERNVLLERLGGPTWTGGPSTMAILCQRDAGVFPD